MSPILLPIFMTLLFTVPMTGAISIGLYTYSVSAIFDPKLKEKPAKLHRQQNARRAGHFTMIAAVIIAIALLFIMSQIIAQSRH